MVNQGDNLLLRRKMAKIVAVRDDEGNLWGARMLLMIKGEHDSLK